MNWAPGTIIVCVDDHGPGGAGLAAGSYYTVRMFNGRAHFRGAATGWKSEYHPGVRLNEIVRPITVSGQMEDGFYLAARFRLAESSHSESATARQKEPTNA